MLPPPSPDSEPSKFLLDVDLHWVVQPGLILVPILCLRLGLVLVHDLFASPVANLTAATRTTALILLHSSSRNRHSPHASQGCNSQPAPLIGATRRVPLRVSATISGIYCLTSRMQIGQHWRPNQSTCQAICHSGSSAANCDRPTIDAVDIDLCSINVTVMCVMNPR